MIYEILLTIVLIYLIHLCLCGIIHIINGTKSFPRTLKHLFTRYLNIFWVLYNLKKLRDIESD